MREEPATGVGGAADILLEAGLGWKYYKTQAFVFWHSGYLNGDGFERLAADLVALNGRPSMICQRLGTLNGHFGLVLKTPTWVLAATDCVRSVPLLIGRDPGGKSVVTQTGRSLEKHLHLGPEDLNQDAILAVALSGYTIGNDTLYHRIRQLGPGEFAVLRADDEPVFQHYHHFQPWLPENGTHATWKRHIGEATRHTIEKLIDSIDGRPIALPLSAGLDSRLIASGLKELGYKNVRCFAYGIPGNHEAKASRAIAAHLGFPWCFVPYSNRRQRDIFNRPDHRDFVSHADSLTGVHFEQEFLALTELANAGWLPKDTIVVNGQSGDFITGNHIHSHLLDVFPDRSEHRLERVIGSLTAKHFKHWRFLLTPRNLTRLEGLLRREIGAIGGLPEDSANDYGIYEWCEFQDRQCKYVVNGVRLYEYLGYDWRMPLWDKDFMDIWATAPLSEKKNQRLYRDVLLEQNWGGVWTTIPINAKRIRPNWLRPIRFALKALHAPVGRQRWHAFETRYLSYWMSNLCGYGGVPYRQVAADHRGHISSVSFQIEAYLAKKGVELDALALATA